MSACNGNKVSFSSREAMTRFCFPLLIHYLILYLFHKEMLVMYYTFNVYSKPEHNFLTFENTINLYT